MISLRLKTIADLISKKDIVLDVGTDHGYLPIYLKENNLCKNVYASDVSENALNVAKKNIQEKKLDIKLFLTDGINNIDVKYNTLTISGMGASTIIKIIDNKNLPNKIILSSNNDLEKLRLYMNKIGYKIVKEIAVLDKKKYYDIILYEKGIEKLNKKEILFGKSNNKEYYNYLYQMQKEIYQKVNFKTKIKMIRKLNILKKIAK